MERNASNKNVGMEAAMPQSGEPCTCKFMAEAECPNLCNLMTLRHVVDAGTVVKDVETGDDIDLCALIERAEEEFRNMVRLLNT